MLTESQSKKQSGLAFHCHHDELFEWVTDYQERVDYIEKRKPQSEQELRLRLFKMIPEDRIPPEFVKAGEAYTKAHEAFRKGRYIGGDIPRAFSVVGWTYNKVYREYEPEMIALHKELCPGCTWDGKTIFPGEALNEK